MLTFEACVYKNSSRQKASGRSKIPRQFEVDFSRGSGPISRARGACAGPVPPARALHGARFGRQTNTTRRSATPRAENFSAGRRVRLVLVFRAPVDLSDVNLHFSIRRGKIFNSRCHAAFGRRQFPIGMVGLQLRLFDIRETCGRARGVVRRPAPNEETSAKRGKPAPWERE